MTDYDALCEEARGLIKGVPYLTADLANVSSLVFNSVDDLNWAGFYVVDGEKLLLGPFQGKPACIVIPMGRGVCGTAAALNATQCVDDVHEFPGHIACDSASASELVVPVRKDGVPVAVLDLDSERFARFTKEDARGFEKLAKVIEEELCDLF